MNRKTWSAMVLFISLAVARPDVICQWNFNSAPPDDATATGRTVSSLGIGTATLLHGATGSFAAGSTKDPATVDDSCWVISSFPQVMVSNRMAGIRFAASTAGFEQISVSWAQQNSSTASRYLRPQYSLDGVNFLDLPSFAVVKESAWTNLVFDLAGIAGANQNPNFAFRIVTEFESTATGGLPGFMPTASGSSYLPSGTIKFDLVTISGTAPFDGNNPPYITSQIESQTLRANEATGLLPFTVLDAEDPAATLLVSASSSDSSVIPLANLTLGGSGANRTVKVSAGTTAGTSTITLKVLDSGNKSNTYAFAVTVLPANQTPACSCMPPTYVLLSSSTSPLGFIVGDPETSAEKLTVLAGAADTTLLPQTGLVLGGAGSNRTLALTPAPGRAGATPVTLAVSDGSNVATCIFPCVVLPSPQAILYDSFNYPDGSIGAKSGMLWQHRSGTAGDCWLDGGRLHLSQDRTEDVSVPLFGGPYETGSNTILYVSFKLQVPTIPIRPAPEYFAHFLSGGTLISRIYIGTNTAVEKCFRLSVSNVSATNLATFPMSMDRNVLYTVILRYDVDAASTRLWVNPQTEASASVIATDSADSVRVNSFGLRQSQGIGDDVLIDEVKIGYTFESVTSGVTPVLRFVRGPSNLSLSWDDSQMRLQSSGSLSGPFTNVPGAISPWPTIPSASRAFFRLMR